jgi:hypothetical protein
MASSNWKKVLRLIFVKFFGALLAIVFLFFALWFISYPLLSFATTQGGADAKVTAVSDRFNKMKTGCRVGGLFTVSVEMSTEKMGAHSKNLAYDKIYCLYPVWPDQLQPDKGNLIRVWPAKKPLFGEPLTDGWGWFIVGTVLVVGLLMLEFSFLALTIG